MRSIGRVLARLTPCLVLSLLALQLPLAPAAAQEEPKVEFYPPPGRAQGPFSEAVRVGNLLILSGMLGTTAQGLVPGGIEPETRQTLENIKATLERHGSSMDRVVKCLVMMADIAEWPRMNTVYVTFFPGPKPARSAFAGSGLALNARVEIECWATVK